ncbi:MULTISPECIES: 2-dehydropantoate 2-reductase [Cobetia]|uniref:ketopantoate reductase family protein n=1 Tax=Cobetia TaxID=204286 RepID=UPI0020C5CDCA|nr:MULTISPECIES: 2-dehydropantoate 2-reductase [Cobetia]MDI4660385.1 2-dehydropantoate 2-reductase [Cobetia sp. BMC6]
MDTHTMIDPEDNWLWIIGPGAIGRLLAASLMAARQRELREQGTSELPRVLLLGRQAMPGQAVALEMTTPEALCVIEKIIYSTIDTLQGLPSRKPSAIWLTTKAHGVPAVWQQLTPHITPETPVTCWQNGLSAQPWLAERHANLLCASTTEGAWLPAETGASATPDTDPTTDDLQHLGVQHAGRGHTWLGAWQSDGDGDPGRQSHQAALLQCDWLRAAGFACEQTSDIQTRLWHKLAINAAINPLVARYRIRNGQLRDQPFAPMVRQAVEEISTVLDSEGIPAPGGGWQALVEQVIRATANNRASMLQDVLAGRPTEVEAILGPLRSTASRHGLALPLLNDLYHQLSTPQR